MPPVDFVTEFATTQPDDNLWALQRFHRELNAFQDTKVDSRVKEFIRQVALNSSTPEPAIGNDSETLKDIHYLYRDNDGELADLDIDDTSLLTELYVLFQCLKSGSLEEVNVILRHVLGQRVTRVGRKNMKDAPDVYDCTFACMQTFVTHFKMCSDVQLFVSISKDLFYFKCTKKQRLTRVNLLIRVATAIHRRKPLYARHTLRLPSECSYMFVTPQVDERKRLAISGRRCHDAHTKVIHVGL